MIYQRLLPSDRGDERVLAAEVVFPTTAIRSVLRAGDLNKMATYLGIVTSTVSFLYGLFLLVRTLIWGNPGPGYPSLIIVMLFLGGVQLICLGIQFHSCVTIHVSPGFFHKANISFVVPAC